MSIVHASTQSFDSDIKNGVVVVDFWAPWCGPCKILSPILDEFSVKFEGQAKVVKVNVDENPELASRFGVMSIPTIVTFKDGQPVDKKVGVQNLENLSNIVKTHF